MTNIKRVSEMAGVSTATVTRTLKNPELVRPVTREKVMRAVKESGYRPNWLASSVKSGKSNTLVVLVPNLVNPFFLRVIGGIEQAAQEAGYTVLLGDTQGKPEREHQYASMVLTARADGLIQLDHSFPFSPEDAELGEKAPMVSVCDRVVGHKYPFIELDNFGASRAMAHYLMALGHRRIGVIAGQRSSQIYRDRCGGLVRALEEEDITFDDELLVGGAYCYANGEASIRQLMSLSQPPTAVVCFNDDIAIGAIREAKAMGLSVPGDVSITGFDNIQVSPYIDPPLTTIDQPALEMGRRSVEVLINVIEGNIPSRLREILPYQLIVRGSAGQVHQ